MRAAKPDAIHTGKTVTAYRNTPGNATLDFADGSSVERRRRDRGRRHHSRMRSPDGRRRQAGLRRHHPWRGLVPIERLNEDLRRPVGTNWVGLGRARHHLSGARRRAAQFCRLRLERNDWMVEPWTERGTVEECAADLVGWHPLRAGGSCATSTSRSNGRCRQRDPLETMADGRACLIGDACHPMLPFLAQGATRRWRMRW